MSNPKISVIVPVYNAEKYLSACLDSVLAQTFTDYEVLCVNDGSTDKSPKILGEYAVKDKRIRLINQDNRGNSAARNAGMSVAAGEFICFVDADDYLHPQALFSIDNVLRRNTDVALVHYGYFDIDSDTDGASICKNETLQKIEVVENPLSALALKADDMFFAVWRNVYRKEALAGLCFDEHCSVSEDVLFNMQVLAKSDKIAEIGNDLYFYRVNPDSVVHRSVSPAKISSYLYVAERLYDIFGGNKDLRRDLQVYRINQNLKNALKAMQRCEDKDFVRKVALPKIKELYRKRIINYKGLSLSKKALLFRIVTGMFKG